MGDTGGDVVSDGRYSIGVELDQRRMREARPRHTKREAAASREGFRAPQFHPAIRSRVPLMIQTHPSRRGCRPSAVNLH